MTNEIKAEERPKVHITPDGTITPVRPEEPGKPVDRESLIEAGARNLWYESYVREAPAGDLIYDATVSDHGRKGLCAVEAGDLPDAIIDDEGEPADRDAIDRLPARLAVIDIDKRGTGDFGAVHAYILAQDALAPASRAVYVLTPDGGGWLCNPVVGEDPYQVIRLAAGVKDPEEALVQAAANDPTSNNAAALAEARKKSREVADEADRKKAEEERKKKYDTIRENLLSAGVRAAKDADEKTLDWMGELAIVPTKNGCMLNGRQSLVNLATILRNDPRFASIAYDSFSSRYMVTDIGAANKAWGHMVDTDELTDTDYTRIRQILQRDYNLPAPKDDTVSAINEAAESKGFNVYARMFDSLPAWDGKDRCGSLFCDYLGAPGPDDGDEGKYTAACGRLLVTSLAARAHATLLTPVKSDYMAILAGPQGCGKSTLVSWIGGGHKYTTSSLTLSDLRDEKITAEKMGGHSVCEIGERVCCGTADEVAQVKNIITETTVTYRAAYDKVARTHVRQTTLIGTTNDGEDDGAGFLQDLTGNRRFLPIACSRLAKIPDYDEEERKQIWAQGMYYWQSCDTDGTGISVDMRDGSWVITLAPDIAEIQEEICRRYMVKAGDVADIEAYLSKWVPENWQTMPDDDRLNYLSHNIGQDNANAPAMRPLTEIGVTVRELLYWIHGREALGNKSLQAQYKRTLKAEGWESSAKTGRQERRVAGAKGTLYFKKSGNSTGKS